MRQSRLARVAVMAAFMLAVGVDGAMATPLATIPIRLFSTTPHGFGDPVIASSIDYSVWVDAASDPAQGIGVGNLLLHFTLTNADAGQTLVASALNMGAGFTAAVALLTNSTLNDFISDVAGFAGSGSEGDGTIEAGTLDLRGKTVGSVKLVVDELTIASPGSNPNHDGNWTDAHFTGSLVFDTDTPVAPAPEPGTLGLVAFGFGTLALRRRWQRFGGRSTQ